MPSRSKDSDDIDNVGGAGRIAKNLRVQQAYKKGKDRNDSYHDDPSKPGGPSDDGYGNMSPEEKDAYKRGHRGD